MENTPIYRRFIPIRISQIETRILALKGIIDIFDTALNGKTSNLSLGKFEVPILGGVTGNDP